MEDFQHIDAIEAYLEQRLSLTEREAFEQQLIKDAALKAEFDAYRAALKLLEIKVVEGSSLRSRGARRPVRRWLQAAAVALILLAAGLWAYAQFGFSDQALAIAHYQEPRFSTSLRGAAGGDADYQKALTAYQQQQYTLALDQLAGLQQDEARYLAAHCAFHLNEIEVAITAFEAIAGTAAHPRRESAAWYLALSYLKKGDRASAVRRLQSIAEDPDHANRQKALDLMERIRRPWRKLVF